MRDNIIKNENSYFVVIVRKEGLHFYHFVCVGREHYTLHHFC